MGFFDFLFGNKLTIERLVKLDEDEVQRDLKKRNVAELQKFCLKGCQNLNSEEAQKDIYVNAIMQFIREKRAELSASPLPENVETAIEESVESKPVDLEQPPVQEPMPAAQPEPMAMNEPEMAEQPPHPNPTEEEKPHGGKHKGSKKRGGRTKRRRDKKEKDMKESKKGGKKNSRKKDHM